VSARAVALDATAAPYRNGQPPGKRRAVRSINFEYSEVAVIVSEMLYVSGGWEQSNA
jgi:hypothetical protein